MHFGVVGEVAKADEVMMSLSRFWFWYVLLFSLAFPHTAAP